jgi:mannose-6-phosphate isomerase-like protein (cupin superfamily)
MNIIQKPWGTTTLIFDSQNLHIYSAIINKNGASSRHYHKYKNNIFYVQRGMVSITLWSENTTETKFLNEGDIIDIPKGQWHQFFANEESIVLEVYYSRIDHEDIIRSNQ